MKPITVSYTCPECEKVFNVIATPEIPAQTYGPAENCYPAEGGDIDPDECPGCGHEIDTGDVSDLVADTNEQDDRDPRDDED